MNKQRQVDDYPYGGGRGAVMQADPLYRCWQHICDLEGERIHTIYMSPAGRTFCQADAKRVLIPVNHSENFVVGVPEGPVSQLVQTAAQKVKELCTTGCK